MLRAIAFLWCSTLVAGDLGLLQRLTDNNRYFELRRALQQPGWNGGETRFYQALVASRFGQEASGIALLEQVLQSHPSPAIVRKAHEEIASALERIGRYKEAAEELTQALLLIPQQDPEQAENANNQLLMAALSDVAAETVEFGADVPIRATRTRLGSWDVPVQVNGARGQWIFDTGAGMSTLTESEAKRMGLSVVETKTYVRGSTGHKNTLRLAVAGDLQFGPARLHNVVFLVLADAALAIGPLHYQITGILGLPVLRALGRLGISSDGAIGIHPGETASREMPNLFFDDDSPIVEISHAGHRLQMFLDTGANDSTLYPSSRNALTHEETLQLRTRREKTAGAGGMIKRKAIMVPALRIEFFETPINLRKLSLLPEAPAGSSRYRDGVIGMDALWGGFLLDFTAMRLEVE